MKDFWLEKFEKEVYPIINERLNPKQVILFGSRAIGKGSDDSDLDIIIISEKFRTIHKLQRMSFVLKQLNFKKHIDILFYTPDEFERAKKTSAVVQDALENSYYIS